MSIPYFLCSLPHSSKRSSRRLLLCHDRAPPPVVRIDLLLVEAGGLASEGVEEDLVGDLALAGWVEDLER